QLSNVESTDEFNAPPGEASVPPGDGDDEFSSDEGSEAELEEDEAAVMSYNVNELLDKLDVMLDLVLSWIKQQFSDALSNESKQVEFHQLFLNCLEIFDSVLLPTFKSRYTQFVMFYMCSLDAYFCDLFLGGIVAKLGDPIPSRQVLLKEGESVVIRVAAASYLGSFVARANYLSSTVVRNVMGVLTQWVNTYLDWLEQPSDEQICYEKGGAGYTQQQQSRDSAAAVMNQHRHSVFYAVSQAIMYIFCFRWRELTASNDPAFESSEADRLDLYTTPSRSFGKHGSSDLDAYSLRVNGNSPDMCDIKWCPELSGIHRLIFSRLNPLK
ncbi:DNA independent RNA polymerase I transcription factor, partial [Spiromyces aspiralis]